MSELSGRFALSDLLECAGLARSTYYYALAHPKNPTRPELWDAAREIFSRTPNGCGHRQIAMCLRAERGAVVADKTVLKMMGEMGLRCGIRRETDYHRYNSYKGVVGETFENVIGRDFAADGPWQKMGTDVTEFMLVPLVPAGAHPVMQSDMGWQYQSARYVERLRGAGFVQSMSRKGNCLDNACTEGLFGHMKDEFFRGRDWDDFESFKADLEAYIVHWNTRRRQKRLKGLTPEEFRNQSLMAA